MIADASLVTIRILEPEEVAHGMNYFWRATHLARHDQRPPCFVHANGVDEKVYFMRDRGIWYLDDWDARFGPSDDADAEEGSSGVGTRFLQYEHPVGLSLRRDFETLLSALEIAKMSGRRLLLPKTMNCKNSPAYEAFGLSMKNCTVDHFASAKILLHYHNESVVEAALVGHPRFLTLARMSKDVREATGGVGGIAKALIDDAEVAQIPVLVLTGDIIAARGALRQAKGMALAETPFHCKYGYSSIG